MLSPMMTVFVLAVLWLIVVVPMIFRRHDERRREKSVAGFGRAMRALGRRAPGSGTRTQVFVPNAPRPSPTANAVSTRRPVPAAQEALMYPVERSEMSAARARMMARRRRSLAVLGVGAIVLVPTAVFLGGLMWVLAAPFVLGLVGYTVFLRSQAHRDRERRHNRRQRATRRDRGVDLTAPAPGYAPPVADSAVHIDDDDLELHNLDTVDLTGLYNDELAEAAAQRRAS